MIAAKRYESVWNAFLKELPRNPTITLSSVQKEWHTNRKGMQRWMNNNGLSVKEAKKRKRIRDAALSIFFYLFTFAA